MSAGARARARQVAAALAVAVAAAAAPGVAPEEDDVKDGKQQQVAVLETSKGTMVLELYPQSAPKHVENFVGLAGKGFYDGLTFHRIIPDFMIQGGCPKGDGTGGPGHKVKAEFNDRPHRRGTLSMARAGHPDSAGSQFFICHADAPFLDGKYTNFGHLISGFDTLDAIAALGSPGGKPSQRVSIEKVTIRPRTAEDASSDG